MKSENALDINANVFNSIIELKIQDLTSLIIEQKNLNFRESLSYLYDSTLYVKLTKEETKLWHLSTQKLFEMLEVEKNM
jgi:hypothetical protein